MKVRDIVKRRPPPTPNYGFRYGRIEGMHTYHLEVGPVLTIRKLVQNEFTGDLEPTGVLAYMVPAFDVVKI